jgi:hypothetical protein
MSTTIELLRYVAFTNIPSECDAVRSVKSLDAVPGRIVKINQYFANMESKSAVPNERSFLTIIIEGFGVERNLPGLVAMIFRFWLTIVTLVIVGFQFSYLSAICKVSKKSGVCSEAILITCLVLLGIFTFSQLLAAYCAPFYYDYRWRRDPLYAYGIEPLKDYLLDLCYAAPSLSHGVAKYHHETRVRIIPPEFEEDPPYIYRMWKHCKPVP